MVRLIPLFLLIATSVQAQTPLTMEFQNTASKPANISGVYEILADGTSVDDNLGSSDEIAPGTTMTVTLGITKCKKVEVYAWLGTFDDPAREELHTLTDLCKNRRLTIHD